MIEQLALFILDRYCDQEVPLREVVRQLDAHAADDDDVKGIDGGWTLWGSFGRAVDAAFQPRQLHQANAARRRLVDDVLAWQHKRFFDKLDSNVGPYPCTRDGAKCDPDACGVEEKQRQVLGALAAEFATHVGYRKEWRL